MEPFFLDAGGSFVGVSSSMETGVRFMSNITSNHWSTNSLPWDTLTFPLPEAPPDVSYIGVFAHAAPSAMLILSPTLFAWLIPANPLG